MLVRTFSGDKPRLRLPKGAIDTQLHLYLEGYPSQAGGPPLPAGIPGPDEYRQLMQWLGIERLIITQANAHQQDNSCLLACLEAFGDIAKGVAVIDGSTNDATMQQLTDNGICGARIMDLPGGGVGLDQLEAVDARASAFNWCMAVQFDGSNILQHESRLLNLKSRYIFDHHGKFFSGVTPDSVEIDALKRLLDTGNCWFKFAGCYESSLTGGPDYADIAAVAFEIARYAPERIIWGSNFPHNLAQKTEDYPNDAALLDLLLDWVPDSATRHKIFVDNPSELFGFNE